MAEAKTETAVKAKKPAAAPQKAPAAVVEKERQKLVTYHETANKLREQIG